MKKFASLAVLSGLFALSLLEASSGREKMAINFGDSSGMAQLITLFMCGDVMTGRGIDQVMPHPADPALHEPYMKSAEGYVELAVRANGPIPSPVKFSYIWGEALHVLERMTPDVRMINLETSITKSDEYWRRKEVLYRMNPENISCLTAANIDYAALANNHVLDWGYSGLKETLETLKKGKIKYSGAGQNLKEAETPAVMEIKGKGRVIVFSLGSETSGIPSSWGASANKPGVNLLPDYSEKTVEDIKEAVLAVKQPEDIVVASIHWGGNWGYAVPRGQTEFAHKLLEHAGVDVIHGHSSHHVKGLEVYRDKLIIYGCGDFLNDYEGISGHKSFRDDLGLMYFVSVDPATGKLVKLEMIPTQIKKFRVNRASRTDALWLRDVLNREGINFGTCVELKEDNTLALKWH